jgi:hypothetical protein
MLYYEHMDSRWTMLLSEREQAPYMPSTVRQYAYQ